MNRTLCAIALTSMFAATAAYAEGDADAGEKVFKKCKSCHMVANGDDVLAKGGKTGPNLYGVVGRAIASQEGFKYGDSIVALGATGAVWDEASLAEYLAGPADYLKAALDDSGAKSKMSLKLKKGSEDVIAYLASLAE